MFFMGDRINITMVAKEFHNNLSRLLRTNSQVCCGHFGLFRDVAYFLLLQGVRVALKLCPGGLFLLQRMKKHYIMVAKGMKYIFMANMSCIGYVLMCIMVFAGLQVRLTMVAKGFHYCLSRLLRRYCQILCGNLGMFRHVAYFPWGTERFRIL